MLTNILVLKVIYFLATKHLDHRESDTKFDWLRIWSMFDTHQRPHNKYKMCVPVTRATHGMLITVWRCNGLIYIKVIDTTFYFIYKQLSKYSTKLQSSLQNKAYYSNLTALKHCGSTVPSGAPLNYLISQNPVFFKSNHIIIF